MVYFYDSLTNTLIMKQFLFLALLVALMPSCAKSILINYSYDQSQAGGKLVIIPDKPIEGVNFVMNDRLLVRNQIVKKITVENVPPGEHKIAMTCASWYYKDPLNYVETVQISPNQETTKLVPTPPYSGGYYAYLIGSSLAPLIILLLVL